MNKEEKHIFDRFVNPDKGIIGKTVSTEREPHTSADFWFWLAKEEKDIQIGDMVCARSVNDEDLTFGLVVEMRSITDVASFLTDFLSHDAGDPKIIPPTDIAEVVVIRASIIKNYSEKTRPIGRSYVYFPSTLGIQFAIGMVDKDGNPLYHGVHAGIFENGDGTKCPIAIDEKFLVGPEGAHFNVSGISGLASKTSSLLFLLKSLQTHAHKNLGYILINVKSKDLLYLDKPNPQLEDDEWSVDAYEKLKIPAQKFDNLRIFAPAARNKVGGKQVSKSLRTDGKVETFSFALPDIKQDIPSLFSEEDWDDKMEGVWHTISEIIETKPIVDFAGLLTFLTSEMRSLGEQPNWRGHHRATFGKMLNRLRTFVERFAGVMATTGITPSDIPLDQLKPGHIFVIDIQMEGEAAQKFIFSRVMRKVRKILEGIEKTAEPIDGIVLVVDELNKFGPAGASRSPLKYDLIDITARGRSLGLVLFGAEQFASAVDMQIIDNCASSFIGRTETGELGNSRYAQFSNEIKAKILQLSQGRMLLKQSKFTQPLFIRFPYPPCMTGDQYKEE